ncbi:hypothetical protein M3Y94_01086900 [Aphelenchoides besseyi]|nr:hypothetical protein M3Y94_01086900 [Aphelenchoides besseyi]
MRTIQRVNSTVLTSAPATGGPLSTSSSTTAVNGHNFSSSYQSRASSSSRLVDEEEQLIAVLHHDPNEEPICSTVDVIAGRSLIDSLTPFLTQNGIAPAQVDIFLENSKTPIPTLSEARYLVGQKLNVRLKVTEQSPPVSSSLMMSRLDTKSFHSVDEQDLRRSDTLEDTSTTRITYMDKAGSSRNLLGPPMSFYDGQNNFTVPRRKGSLNVDPATNNLPSPMSIDDRMYGMPEPYCMPLSERCLSGSLNGTRRLRAPSSSRRMTSLFGKEKLSSILDRVYKEVEGQSLHSSMYFDANQLSVDHNFFNNLMKHRKIEALSTRKHQEAFLRSMCDLHKTLLDVQQLGHLRDIDPNLIFLNFSELYQTSLEFWRRGILPMINHSKETGEPLNALLMRDAFDDILVWSHCYIDFNINHNNSHSYIQKRMKENEQFAEFWVEAKPFMNRQRLTDILTSPVQHLTRYPLMLTAVLRTTPHKEHKLSIQTMLDKADEANVTLNYHMSNNEVRLELTEIMRTIENYDVIDVDEYSKLFPHHCPIVNLISPMPLLPMPRFRHMYTRGDLKLKENKTTTKTEVHCILFTDMLLICKSTSRRADRLRIIKPPLHVSSLKLSPFMEGNGFYVVSRDAFGTPSSFYMFYTINQEESKRWLELIRRAQNDFLQLAYDPECAIHAYPQKQFPYRDHSLLHFPSDSFYHRKSHSMDSHAIAHHASTNGGLRREAEVASAEQLDRRGFDQHPPLPHQPYSTGSATLNRPQKILVDDDPTCDRPQVDVHQMNSDDKHDADSLDSGRAGDETPSTKESPSRSNGADTSRRRFEKRYHTVGEVEPMKPSPLNSMGPQAAILKRFSWNVGSQKKINRLSEKNQLTKPTLQHSRRFSQSTTESNDSFGSSSGISTSSSHDTNTPAGSRPHDLPHCHISRFQIDEHLESQTTIGSPISNTTITTSNTAADELNDTLNIELKPPPLPHVPPPDTCSSSDEQDDDDPNSTDDLSGNGLLFDQTKMLQLILSDNLDTSTV